MTGEGNINADADRQRSIKFIRLKIIIASKIAIDMTYGTFIGLLC
jgi:hypothetical protein